VPRKKKAKPSDKIVGRLSSSDAPAVGDDRPTKTRYPEAVESINPLDGLVLRDEPAQYTAETPRRGEKEKTELTKLTELENQSGKNSDNSVNSVSTPPRLTPVYSDAAHGIYLYQNNCLAILDAIAAKYPEGRFDMIFADPPYFLSNGGITCHAGKMVSVHKGDWDKSQGAEENHNFNREWLMRCQRVLKPNGTIWVSGTHHVIFSVGFAMQQLGFKILNDIAWEKPNPPPNLSCRYFTHSTETILWAAKSEKSKHLFNYAEMRKVTGKQMKTVWRKEEFPTEANEGNQAAPNLENENFVSSVPFCEGSVWTMQAPGRAEKEHGKHPTQKPVAGATLPGSSTNRGDWVLDPFLRGGTTAVAALRTGRNFVGISTPNISRRKTFRSRDN
jgi:site-specific DNA-methyltransferase (adenine-specific)